ncbi:catechol 2,3-dioxygenase-like lactoylglutathione lyase family enzyme [Burkholderia sp. OAS925]|uniref:VOC family protein n=1 Tax=Paraburkholderia TaxID=1822464 RepID=UPI00178902D7|nr:VOC family protein [Paraburkholderia graminis]MDR6478877.1 catechol 2,3-dioxygenase-like lactoylglutathione lyase family enzyme [Paraburkholderia graminis]
MESLWTITNGEAAPNLLGERMQLSFVVPNLQEALKFWTETVRVGPFIVIEDLGDRHFFYRGKESPVKILIGFSYIGDTQIELIEQINSAASPYTDFLDGGRQGLHHIGFWPDDCEKARLELDRCGFEEVLVIQASDGGNKVTYHNGPAHIGAMFEIAPMTPERAKHFAGLKALADNWDGTRPVRWFRTRAEYMASEDCKS